jgi:RHS repeat-associated protein
LCFGLLKKAWEERASVQSVFKDEKMRNNWFTISCYLVSLLAFQSVFAGTQEIKSSKSNITVKPGDTLDFDVIYTASSPQNTTGLGLRLFYDSSKLTAPVLSNIFQKKIAHNIVADDDNSDGDSQTDKKVNIAWADLNGKWPGTNADTTLFNIRFTVANNFTAGAKINSRADTSAGNGFIYTQISINPNSTTPDTTPPAITAPADKTIEARKKFTTVTTEDLGTPTVTDNKDASPSFTFSPTEPLALGKHVITWTATDSAGNHASAKQTVNIVDTTPPTINAPGDKTVAATGRETAVDIGVATATDKVDVGVLVSSDAPDTFTLGKHTITWTAKDESGNTATATQIITVTDGDGPSISAPADISKEATGKTTPVDLGTATASDALDGELTATADKTGPFTVGEHTITWTVKDSANNTASATQKVTITDTTKPEITLAAAVLKINASGVRTRVLDFGVTAKDIVDGAITPVGVEVINGIQQPLPSAGLESGKHQITWKASDKAGNTITTQQTLEITPLVNFIAPQTASAGDTVTVSVELSGKPVSYPVTIPYSIAAGSSVSNDGSDHNAKNGKIVIKSGTQGSFSFKVADNPALNGTGRGELVFVMGSPIHAVIGSAGTHKVTISADNIAPVVKLSVKQSGKQVSVVGKNAGKVVITANASDSASQTLSYDWSQTDAALNDLSSQGNVFEFDPSGLTPGAYTVRLTVKDNGSPAKQTTVNTRLIIKAGTVAVADTDEDGIPDDRDNVPEPNRLPAVAGASDKYILQSETGTKLRLGNVARSQGADSAGISTTGLPQIPADYKNDSLEIYDFQIDGIAQGKSSLIVLPQHKAIPADAVYLKMMANAWKPFAEDSKNALYSAQRLREGVCPPTGDARYKPGLKQGDYCVQLKIQDGGANDTDGLKNGRVADPGVIVGKAAHDNNDDTGGSTPPPTGNGISGGSGGGGSFGWLFVMLLAGVGLVRKNNKLFLMALLLILSGQSFAGSFDDIDDEYFRKHGDICDSCTKPGVVYKRVRFLQRVLNADPELKLNPKLIVDGKWGDKTKSAVKKFQTKNRLVSDGYVGMNTKKKLDKLLARLKAATASPQATPADLSVRSQDISIYFPSVSGTPKVGDEFYVKAKAYNNGETNSGHYQLRFSYKNSSTSSFSSFDGEYDGSGVDAGQVGRVLQSKNKEIDGVGGTHQVQVCVYNTSDNGPIGNDCATKSFTVASDSSNSNVKITSVNPTKIRTSLYPQTITIEGEGFTNGMIVEASYGDFTTQSYIYQPSITSITNSQITVKDTFLGQPEIYFRIKLQDGSYSKSYQADSYLDSVYSPRLWLLNSETDQIDNDPSTLYIDSGEMVSIQTIALDLDNLKDQYGLNINWGDGNNVNKNVEALKSISLSHSYSTSKTRSFTVSAYAQDVDGHKSQKIQFRVMVKGSSVDSKPIQNVAYNSKKEAKAELGGCKVNNSVDTATGSENFTIDLLKTTGLSTIPFSLSYNSSLLSRGNISNGWSHNFRFTSYLEIKQNGDVRVYWDDSVKKYNDFSEEIFESKIYRSTDKDVLDDILVRSDDDSFTLTTRKNRTTYRYNKDGQLLSISNYKNNKLELAFVDGRIFKVTEPVSGVYLQYLYAYSSTDKTYRLTQVEDNSGRTVSLEYDSNGNLSQINATEGTIYTFSYNELGQIEEYKINGVRHFALIYDDKGRVKNEDDGLGNATAVVDYSFDETTTLGRILSEYKNKSGKLTKFVYDAENFNLYSATDPRGFTTGNEYYTSGNNKGKIKKNTDALGNNTSYEYDSNGNITRITYQDGSKVEYQYDANRNKTNIKTISKTGQVLEVKNTFDSNNNLIETINAKGDKTTFSYNANNQLLTKTTPEGITTKNEYTSGRLSKTIYAQGTADEYSVQFAYDQLGRLIRETDPFGKVTKYTYDDADRLTSVEDPLGNKIFHYYDYRGNRIKTIDKNGNVTSFTYDNNNNQITKTDAMGNFYQYEYDSSDRLSKTIDPLGNETSYEYDEVGNLIKQTDATGNSVRFVYDGLGNIFKQYDAYNQRITINTYDSQNNLIETKDSLNRTVKKEYDVLGNVTKTTDPLNRITSFSYDKLGQLTTVTNPQNKQVKQFFDKDGRLKYFIDTNNNKTEFTYDNAGNILTTKTAAGSISTNSYISGRLEKTKNARGDSRHYTYDANSRIKSVSDTDGTINYTYDKNDNVLTIKQNGKTIAREYDALNRVTRYTGEDGNTIQYDYDGAGNLTRLTYPDNKKVSYVYDANNRLISVKDWNNKETQYQYDKNGRLIKTIRPNGTVLTRTYNSVGQLTHQKDVTASGIVIAQYDYKYDKAGNIIKEESLPAIDPQKMIDLTMSYKAGNQLAKVNTKTPVFDADENITSLPLANGTMSLTYDSRNRLTSAAGVTSAYDAENHRVSTTNAQGKTNYVINPESPLSQVLIMYRPGPQKTSYVYGKGLVSQVKDGQTLYYHYDMRGSTVAITNQNGDIIDRFSYLPFGGVIQHTLGNTETPFLYNGRDGVMNDGNGLYYMRARFYSPEIRRFVNRDTLLGDVMVSNALNRFAYVTGNPVNSIDPLGLFELNLEGLNNIFELTVDFFSSLTADLRRRNHRSKINKHVVRKIGSKIHYTKNAKNKVSKVIDVLRKSKKIRSVKRITGKINLVVSILDETIETSKTIGNSYCIDEANRAGMALYGSLDTLSAGFLRGALKTAYSIPNALGIMEDESYGYMENWINNTITIGNGVDSIKGIIK